MRTTTIKPLLALSVLLLSAPLYADPGHGHGNGHGHGHQGNGKTSTGSINRKKRACISISITAMHAGWRYRTG